LIERIVSQDDQRTDANLTMMRKEPAMTYGPMFGFNHIPVDVVRKFDRLYRLRRGHYAALRAVCDSKADLDLIIERLKAENRQFSMQSREAWTGVYCL